MNLVVYCAGPFRAKDHWGIWQNINHAATWSLEIWKQGAACLCPHCNTFPYQGVLPDHRWLDGDLEMLRRCDAVFMIPGWEKSEGAIAERNEAIKCHIPVFEDFGHLCAWIQVNKEGSDASTQSRYADGERDHDSLR
jgi:hypothetical protein